MSFKRNSIILVIGLGVIAAVFFALQNVNSDSTSANADTGVSGLMVGDCLTDIKNIDDLVGGLASDELAADCSTPHLYEVFYKTFFDEGDSSLDIALAADDVCAEQFEGYVGNSKADSSLNIFFFSPSEDSWQRGDRELICLLSTIDGSVLEQSVKDSGL